MGMEGNENDSKSYRIIMRRDQVQKLCANHYINAGQELSEMVGSNKAFTWFAKDYADPEEPKIERLCGKFRNVEDAKKFKDKFVECAAKLNGGEVKKSVDKNEVSEDILKQSEQSI